MAWYSSLEYAFTQSLPSIIEFIIIVIIGVIVATESLPSSGGPSR